MADKSIWAESREDSSCAKPREDSLSEANSSDAGSSGAIPLDEDGGSHCSSLPAAKLDKI